MATYSSFAELQDNILKWGDHVIFEHEGYKITAFAGHYGLINEIDNFIENKIFQLLGLNAYEFCEQHYNHLPEDWEWQKTKFPNLWPPHCYEDYESITRVFLELFRLIEEVPKQLAETSELLFID